MKYLDGQVIVVGDEVDLGGGMTGVVVCDFETKQHLAGFALSHWTGFNAGVLVNSQQAGAVHFDKPDVDLVLLRRATNPP